MSLYLIGDVQGCDSALAHLLETLDFSPSRDTLYLLGDLVNRGPDSAGVLRRLMGYGASAQCLLGNHDLHLLAVAHGIGRLHRSDTLAGVLDAPDREAMLDWLRRQRLAMLSHGVLMVHAGVLPGWTADQTVALAAEVEAALVADLPGFLRQMYGNEPNHWQDTLAGADRLRVVVNALTRIRYCTADGQMEFKVKSGGAADAPAGFVPWFEVPGRRTAGTPVAFGHWSTLGAVARPDVISLDTGCVWGGCLSAWALTGPGGAGGLRQVQCEQAQAPGD